MTDLQNLPRTPSFRLDGKRALVTGASRGIGLAAAAALAQAGAEVVLAARNAVELTQSVAAIQKQGGLAAFVCLDVQDIEAVRGFLTDAAAFDILVNNAGTNRPSPFTEVTVDDFDAVLNLNLRAACQVLGQPRATQRKAPVTPDDEVALTEDIIALARQYGRYGYRRITALLRDAGWLVNKKRVERIWRQEGLKVPQRQPKRDRLWLNDGSCIRLKPERPNHVWAYDFVEDRTHDGRKIRMLNIVDEFTREALAIRVARRLNSHDVIDLLSDLFIWHGAPAHIRSDNGPEFIAKAVQDWIAAVGTQTAYITPGSPWENGYIESFNAQLSDEFLNGEIFYTLQEAKILIEAWRRQYNTIRPHSSLGYRPPAPEVLVWPAPRLSTRLAEAAACR